MKRVVWLDVARACAILGVISCHAAQRTSEIFNDRHISISYNLEYGFSLGKYGVEIFFFISGVLLSYLYTINFSLSDFLIKRFARILPLWLIFLSVGVVTFFYINEKTIKYSIDNTGFSLIQIIFLTITFTFWAFALTEYMPIRGGWSIQAEVMHYTLFLFIRRKDMKGLVNFSFYFTGLGFLINTVSKIHSQFFLVVIFDRLNSTGIFGSTLFFILGMVFQRIFLTDNLELIFSRRFLDNFGTLEWIKLLLTTVFFLFCYLPYGRTLEALGYTFLGIVGAISLNRTYLNNLLVWIGKRSYFLYFIHFYIIDWCFKILQDNQIFINFITHLNSFAMINFYYLVLFGYFFFFTLLIGGFLSNLSFKLIEKPILSKAHKIVT